VELLILLLQAEMHSPWDVTDMECQWQRRDVIVGP
jgi:hypothetical protein